MSEKLEFEIFVMAENETIENRPELDDPDLIRRAQMEDISAYEQLVCRYYGPIYGLVYGLVGNRDDAEDVARSVFVKAWKAIRHFREKSDFSSWVDRIAMQQAARFHRRHSRRKAVRFEEFSLEAKQSDSYKKFSQKGAVLRKMSLRDFQKKMEEALSVIPHKNRLALILHDVQGLTPLEMAKITGGSENTATSRLLHARKKLASKFSSLDEMLVGVSETDVQELLSLKRFELPSSALVEKNIENVMRAVWEAHKRPSLHHFPDKSMGWMFAQPRYGVAALFILFLALHILDRPLPDAPVGAGTVEEPTLSMEVMDGTETNFVPTVGSPMGVPVHPSLIKPKDFIKTNP
jgi:RNA polymerase sigma-70 factor (ECF subfamily)